MEGAAPKGRKESMDGCASPPEGTELIHETPGTEHEARGRSTTCWADIHRMKI